MMVLGIDPGYGRCGVAVVEKRNRKETLVYSSCVETSARSEYTTRLATVVYACTALMTQHKPDVVALEKLFFTKNQKTAMRVSEVRGAIIAEATKHKIPVFEYTPNEVKSAVTSFGRADKRNVAGMLRVLLRIEKNIVSDDECDAIAIALTHLARAQQQRPLASTSSNSDIQSYV